MTPYVFQQNRPFFFLYFQDALRSFEQKVSPQWSNDNHSHSIPLFLRKKGHSGEMVLENLIPSCTPLVQVHHGAAWSLANVKWCFLLNRWRSFFATPRVRSQKICSIQLSNFLDALSEFRSDIPALMSFSESSFITQELLEGPIEPGTEAHSNACQVVQFELMQTLFVGTLETILNDFGLKNDGSVDSWEMASARFKLEQALASAFWR